MLRYDHATRQVISTDYRTVAAARERLEADRRQYADGWMAGALAVAMFHIAAYVVIYAVQIAAAVAR